jgi:flagella synthesis protein FlgN
MQFIGNGPAASLQQENQATRQLIDILKHEQEHLIKADIDSLTALAEEKAQTVAQLTALSTTRHQAVAAAGFTANETSMQEWLNSPAATVADNESWAELLNLARSAKELNRVNGLLIGKHMSRTQTALNVLYGNVPGGAIYGPNGQTKTQAELRKPIIG